ncbi:MAG: ArnT family glycosyltransferase, partial [Candidatus Udaeobacter sp.]
MVDTGKWLTPRSGTKLVFDKAPLNYWLQAASIRTLGPTPIAARIPSAIAAALTALALWWWGSRLGRERAGWLAAMIYALCPLTMLGLARLAMMDSVLTLCLSLAIIGWTEAYRGSRNWYLLFAAGAALAVMTKGVLGLLLPGAAFLVWLAIRREKSEFLRFPWITAAALFLAIVLPWHIAMWRIHGELFVQEYLVHHQILRFLGRDFGHNGPVWYYLPVLLIGLFPWSAFAGYAWWRSLRYGLFAGKSSFDCAGAIWAVWAGVLVFFFSISRSKLPNYILPALPPLSLLAAIRLDMLWREQGSLKPFETVMIAVGGFIAGTIFLLVGIVGWQWKAQPSELPRPARLLGNIMGLKWEAQT